MIGVAHVVEFSTRHSSKAPARQIAFGLAVAIATGVLILVVHFLHVGSARQEAGASGPPEIESVEVSVEVSVDKAVIKEGHFHGEGMLITFGAMPDRWTPGRSISTISLISPSRGGG